MRFNGTFTIKNLESGQHRTFKVKTQSENARFAPGSRILSMMTGNNNEHDFTSLGFVKQDRIIVWKKYRGTQFEKLANFFFKAMTTDAFDGKIRIDESRSCRRCNRKLTTPESIESGIGPVCAGLAN